MHLLSWERNKKQSEDMLAIQRASATMRQCKTQSEIDAEAKARAKAIKSLSKDIASLQQAIAHYMQAYRHATYVTKDKTLAHGYRSRAGELRREGEMQAKMKLLKTMQEG